MKTMPRLLLALVAVAALSGCAVAPAADPHAAHHAAAPAAGYERQMNAMQEMHRRMSAARTPEERAALQAEHMKAMAGGMSMMCEMGRSDDASATMQRCMDMKDMAMRMMEDRAAPAGPSASAPR